jgi:Cu(I)/Ag(I) efflux system periplasmic protein CusF
MIVRPVSTLILALVMAGFSTLGAAQMNHGNTHSSGMADGNKHDSGMAGDSTQGGRTQGNAKAMPTQQKAESAMNEGMVKKMEKSKGTVTLAHGPMNGMPAMTMIYKVKDAAWLDQLQTGQRIRFATDPADGGMTVTKFELAK